MADPRFFSKAGPFTLGELAKIGQAEILSPDAASALVHDVASLTEAGPEDCAFFDNRKYLPQFQGSRAGFCVATADMAQHAPATMAVLVSKNPYRSYALIAQAFYPIPATSGQIHPRAVIDATAIIGDNVQIGPGAVIGARAQIGAGSIIEANVTIGDAVVIGANNRIMSNASLGHCELGERVVIYPGARIGQPGFGFAPDPVRPVKVPQLGRVIIGNDVEIGANTAIDRGALGDTVIGDGTMIDNLVQIGHNVKIGRCCVIVSQVGISGSTELADYVQLGGQAGVAGHLRLGKGAKVAAKSGLMRDVDPGQAVGGYPAMPIKQWHRQTARLSQIGKLKPDDAA
jgi:UDP-3-O-[3-hydroxymyristoyl] glucosamine N-acyltransferase